MDTFKTKGNEAFKANNYKEAIDWYTKAIAVDPYCEAAGALYSNRAASWQYLHSYSKALEDANLCIKVRPTWLKGYYRKGMALQSLGSFEQARKAYEEVLRIEEGNEEVMEKLREIENELKKLRETTDPKSCRTPGEAKDIGNSLFTAGKSERAALFYTRAIELQKEDTPAKSIYYSNRAACYQQIHLYEPMADDCTNAIRIDDKNVKAYIRRAIAHEGLEKWKLALEDYSAAQRLSPGLAIVSQGVQRCNRAIR